MTEEAKLPKALADDPAVQKVLKEARDRDKFIGEAKEIKFVSAPNESVLKLNKK